MLEALFISRTFCSTFSFPSSSSIESRAIIGANATLLPGIRIGTGALIAAASVVTRDVAPLTVVRGAPATAVGKVESLTHADGTLVYPDLVNQVRDK